MCLLFFDLRNFSSQNDYSLILINMRDEYFDRLTQPCSFWSDNEDIIGGKDLNGSKKGSTWLGMNKSSGKIGVLLNILQFNHEIIGHRESRGIIVTDYLNSSDNCENYVNSLQNKATNFNGFTFVGFEMLNSSQAWHYTNIINNKKNLKFGIHAYGNSYDPTKPWPKVIYGKEKFSQVVNKHKTTESKEELIEELFDAFTDSKQLPLNDVLAEQGKEWAHYLKKINSLFVSIPDKKYGTRTLTIILIDNQKNVDYIEKTREDPITCTDEEIHSNWKVNKYSFKLNSK